MIDSLFNTEKKVKSAVATFQAGVSTSFWVLMTQIIDANIEVVTELILDGRNIEGEEATKEDTDRLRDRLRIYKEVKNTPERMIRTLTDTKGEEPVVDPYQTIKQLKKARKQVSN